MATYVNMSIVETECIDRTVTFQVILSTNTFGVYAMFNYGDVEIAYGFTDEVDANECEGKLYNQWIPGVAAGFNDGHGNGLWLPNSLNKNMIDVEEGSNIGNPGVYRKCLKSEKFQKTRLYSNLPTRSASFPSRRTKSNPELW